MMGFANLCYRSAVDSTFQHTLAHAPDCVLGPEYPIDLPALRQILGSEAGDLLHRLSLPGLVAGWASVPPDAVQQIYSADGA